MTLPADFVEILRCPRSREPVVYIGAAGDAPACLLCPSSRLVYRIDDGVPVLLAEEAREVDDAEVRTLMARAANLA